MTRRLAGLVLLCTLAGVWSLAQVSAKWGKGVKQEDGSTVFHRTFEVPASRWQPGDIANYFIDFEHTKLHVAEANGGKYSHVLYVGRDGNGSETPQMTVLRDNSQRVREISLTTMGRYAYIDLNADGRFDLYCNNLTQQSFIMTDDRLLPVRPDRTARPKLIQTSLDGKTIYRFNNGVWAPESAR